MEMEDGRWEAIGVAIPVLCVCVRNEEFFLLNALLYCISTEWSIWNLSTVFLASCSAPGIHICYPFRESFVRNCWYAFPLEYGSYLVH